MGNRSFESFDPIRKYFFHKIRKGGKKAFTCTDEKAKHNVRMAAHNASKTGKKYRVRTIGDVVYVTRVE